MDDHLRGELLQYWRENPIAPPGSVARIDPQVLPRLNQRAGVPLSDDQVWALDVLESLLERTYFGDPSPRPPADADEAAVGTCRFFDRVWVRRQR